jgi:protein tyrosine/serine phosphatase
VSGRTLSWEGCLNVRDLGRLPVSSSGLTRTGVVVRADNVRRLTSAGWETALGFGVRRVVDLRFPAEEPDEPAAHEHVEVVAVSLFGEHDAVQAAAFDKRVRDADDVAALFAEMYVRTLEQNADRVAAVVDAVAEADGAVVVHCFAGKDRTGLVSALLLSLASVPDNAVAADYALSEPNVAYLCRDWVAAAAADPDEHRLRTRLLQSPAAAMAAVLRWVRESAGGVDAYLREAGVDSSTLHRLRARLT